MYHWDKVLSFVILIKFYFTVHIKSDAKAGRGRRNEKL